MVASHLRTLGLTGLVGCVLCVSGVAAQFTDSDSTVDAATRRQVIEGLVERLAAGYLFPDTGDAFGRVILDRERRGQYDRISGARAFAESLTAHLQAVSKDPHLRVSYSEAPLPNEGTGAPSAVDAETFLHVYGLVTNYGFGRVRLLDGNVGYLELNTFVFEPEWVVEAAVEAFAELEHTDALIVDVRRNGGGSPQTVAFVSSYLFGAEPVHLGSIEWRGGAWVEDFHTRPDVPGRRYGPDKPVYVLTSRETFSAAEAFAYALQSCARAIIVGEPTGGGAHAATWEHITEHFGVFVPSGRAVNPITQTNWERVGVQPDIPLSPMVDALTVAHAEAVRTLAARGGRKARVGAGGCEARRPTRGVRTELDRSVPGSVHGGLRRPRVNAPAPGAPLDLPREVH